MKKNLFTILTLIALFLYWSLSIQGMISLANYPADLAFYLAMVWFLMSAFFTYYLIKLIFKKKKNENSTKNN